MDAAGPVAVYEGHTELRTNLSASAQVASSKARPSQELSLGHSKVTYPDLTHIKECQGPVAKMYPNCLISTPWH